MIFQQLMSTVDPESPPKPCDYFATIGGTGTSGLIAIMLGRVRMTAEECVEAYMSLCDRVFEKKPIESISKASFRRVSIQPSLSGPPNRFRGFNEDLLFKDSPNASCKVYVCRRLG